MSNGALHVSAGDWLPAAVAEDATSTETTHTQGLDSVDVEIILPAVNVLLMLCTLSAVAHLPCMHTPRRRNATPVLPSATLHKAPALLFSTELQLRHRTLI